MNISRKKNSETWKAKIEVGRTALVGIPTLLATRVVKEFIKEIVKIMCPYCGIIEEFTLAKYQNCGELLNNSFNPVLSLTRTITFSAKKSTLQR